MINDLLNIVFFAAFSLNASFLCVSVIEVIFFELAILIKSFAQLAALSEWMMIFVRLKVFKVCILAFSHF